MKSFKALMPSSTARLAILISCAFCLASWKSSMGGGTLLYDVGAELGNDDLIGVKKSATLRGGNQKQLCKLNYIFLSRDQGKAEAAL
ncbi:hypothetical protein ACFX12_009180 [Malus domestica]